MSGTALNVWAIFEGKDQLELAYNISKDILGEPKENIDELITFLKSAPADKLVVYSTDDILDNIFTIPFAPITESEDFIAI